MFETGHLSLPSYECNFNGCAQFGGANHQLRPRIMSSILWNHKWPVWASSAALATTSFTVAVMRPHNSPYLGTSAPLHALPITFPPHTLQPALWLRALPGPRTAGRLLPPLLLRNLIASSKKHRDGNNDGPSGIESFGPHNGGELLYWVGDAGGALSDLVDEPQVIDVRRLTVFDGNKAHATKSYKGEMRYSIVLYSMGSHHQLTRHQRTPLHRLVFLELITDFGIVYKVMIMKVLKVSRLRVTN